MCVFFFMLNFLLPVPSPSPLLSTLSSVSKSIRWETDKLGEEKRYWPFDRSNIFIDIDLPTAQQWASVYVCLCVCVSICAHTPRQGLTVCVCVCAPTVQSVLRESQVICESKEKQIAELKKMSDQSTDSLKNEWEKKVWGKSWRAWIFGSPTPCKQPWARGRLFDSMRLADFAASSQALLRS